MGRSVVEVARELATAAHQGQVDKAGLPYIGHPARVAARVAGDEQAQAVAWLHDVVEDTGTGLAELRAAGIPERVLAAVAAVTRAAGEDPDAYYARVAADPLALAVKRADIADNTAPDRLGALDGATRARLVAKYRHAVDVLDARAAAGTAGAQLGAGGGRA